MNKLKQTYKELLQMFLYCAEEEALYKTDQLSREFAGRAVAPEELVALHHETVQEITKGLPAEDTLQVINRGLAYLLGVMVTHGIKRGRGRYSKENLNSWHDAVLRLSNSLALFESKHKTIVDAVPTGVITINLNGEITFINKQIEGIFSCKAEDVLGKRFVDVLQARTGDEFNYLIIETLETGQMFTDVETELPNGCVISVTTSPIRDEHGKITEVVASIHDISRRKQLEQAVMRNEKLVAVGTLAAGIAHEIRNPLTAVRGFIQLLQPELIQSQKREYLDIIIEELDRVNSVLKDFLSFAKPSSPKRHRVETPALLEEIRILTQSEALLREISLHFFCPVGIPDLYIDKDQIKQVLLNIVKNALDAVGPFGKVGVTAKWQVDSRKVSIRVEDNGVGMDQQTVARIFDPFFTTKESGTGLGMAVTYQIIQNHGGEIEVNSMPGSGTSFIVSLPVLAESHIN